MRYLRNHLRLIYIISIGVLILAGCNKSSEHTQVDQPEGTLTVWVDDAVNSAIVSSIKPTIIKGFSKIQVNIESVNIQGDAPVDLRLSHRIPAGEMPDIIVSSSWSMPKLSRYKLLGDLQPLINSANLPAFESSTLDNIKLYHSQGHLVALPYSIDYPVLLYNKAVFDKFGAGYPKDGMTWDEVIELAKQVSGIREGQTYSGLSVSGAVQLAASELSLTYLDPVTDRSIVEDGHKETAKNPKWNRMIDIFKKVRSIPDNTIGCTYMQTDPPMFSSGQIAMAARSMYRSGIMTKQDMSFVAASNGKWDMVSFPTMEQGGKGPNPESVNLIIPDKSKNRALAWDVLSYLTSTEVQMDNSKNAIGTSLRDDSIRKKFGESLGYYTGKNIDALYKNEFITPIEVSKYLDMIYRDDVTRYFTAMNCSNVYYDGKGAIAEFDSFVAEAKKQEQADGVSVQ